MPISWIQDLLAHLILIWVLIIHILLQNIALSKVLKPTPLTFLEKVLLPVAFFSNFKSLLMRRLKLTIEYDGTLYHGWQRQPAFASIQGTIEKTLGEITQSKITLVGSGRTDSGVHAMGQVAHCEVKTPIPNEKLLKGLNTLLPKDISIKKLETVPPTFHAQKSAKYKTYIYKILNSPVPSPLLRKYSCWIIPPLNIQKMNKAARMLIGKHDFKAFQNQGTKLLSTVREVYISRIKKEPPCIVYEITGSGFLKQMVRNIVGALIEVGKEKMTVEDFKTLLKSKNRRLCPKPAPASGLFLKEVYHKIS